jgi:hypothetical protein
MSAISGVIARLSLAALRHAEFLDLSDSRQLAARLYYYNRAPATPDWTRRLSNPSLAAAYVRLPANDADQALSGGWFIWLPRQPGAHKLYISPTCEHLAEVFCATRALRPTGLKLGANVHNLVRPDKLMAYFATIDELHESAERLATKFKGCPAHGVPFTAEIAGDGLLSWGIDRPRTSWRRWLTRKLARAMLAAPHGSDQARFALQRTRDTGIHPDPWSGMK